MKDIKVNFNIRKTTQYGESTETASGKVFDKFLGIKYTNQQAPSANGGSITLMDFKMNIEYYLILSEEGKTYNIPCDEVWIDNEQ